MTSVYQWEYKAVNKQMSKTKLLKVRKGLQKWIKRGRDKASAREKRVDIRVGTQHMIHFFQTKNYKPSIQQHKAFIQELGDRPVDIYSEMRSRLIEKGETTSFDHEFSGVVGYLTRYLFQTFLRDKITAGNQYEIIGFARCTHFINTCAAFQKADIPFIPIIVNDVEELQSKVEEQCGGLTIKGRAGSTSPQILKKSPKTVVCLGGHDDVVSYKCAEWFSEQTILRDQLIPALVRIQTKTRCMYPYRATLYVIQRMLSIIDQYHRTQPDAELTPYYHNFRSNMTLLTDVEHNDSVLMPTCAFIGSTTLNKLRCIPVYILRVNTEPTDVAQ